MKYYTVLLFVCFFLIFQRSNAQKKPVVPNMDSVQKIIKKIQEGIKMPKEYTDMKHIPGMSQDLPFADSNSKEEKEYIEGMKKLNDILKIKIVHGDKKGMAESYMSLGDLNIKMNKPDAAKHYLQNSVQLSKELNDKNSLASAYGNLSNLDTKQGDYKGAYEYYKLYTLYRDSVENIETSKKFLQAQLKHDYEMKEANAKAAQAKKDMAEKRTRNIQYLIIISFAIIIFAAVVILFIQRKNNRQKQKVNLELQVQKEKAEGALSELQSTQALLIHSEKMASLGELTAGIAHEIQNPLNFVNNFSEVSSELADELKGALNKNDKQEAFAIADDIKENLNKINHHGKRADSIVKGMLQHSRSSTGQKEPTDINALVDEYLRLSYHGLRAKDKSFNATIETHYDESLEKINIVPQDIGRVILNLFTNAFYSVSEKKKNKKEGYIPTVSVSTRNLKDKVEIIVKDNGTGIPQKVLDKIYQPFFTTKPTGQGTGLGLSMSYDIIKAHGGELKVETKEGEFAEFIINLPVK